MPKKLKFTAEELVEAMRRWQADFDLNRDHYLTEAEVAALSLDELAEGQARELLHHLGK